MTNLHPNTEQCFTSIVRHVEEARKHGADERTPTREEVSTMLFDMEHPLRRERHYVTETYWWGDVGADYVRYDVYERNELALEKSIHANAIYLVSPRMHEDRVKYASDRVEFAGKIRDMEMYDSWFEELHHRLLDQELANQFHSN